MKSVRQILRHPSAIIVAGAVGGAFIRFASNIILTHLIAPTAFALVSITSLIMFGVQMVSDVGVATMILRHGPMNAVDRSKMWTMQFVRGIFLALLLFALAEPVAILYKTPELGRVLRVLALFPIIQESASLYATLQLGRRNLLPSVGTELGSRLVGAAVATSVALIWPNVWALVMSMLAQMVTAVVTGHVLSLLAGEGLPRFDFDRAFIRAHWNFSRWIQLGSTFTFVAVQLDKALFPFLFGLPRFGVYGVGAAFALIPAQITQQWSGSVFYPLVVQAFRRSDSVLHQLLRLRTTMLMYAAVVAVGIMAASPGFFYLFYRPAYHEAARFAMLLTAAFYFEMAESSLRHMPLVAKTARYEFLAVIVRVVAFLVMTAGIWAWRLDADVYALAFTLAQATSYSYMLGVCQKGGYVRVRPDMVISGFVMTGVATAFLVNRMPISRLSALLDLTVVGAICLTVMLIIYLRRGLPSLPAEPPEEQLEEIARMQDVPQTVV